MKQVLESIHERNLRNQLKVLNLEIDYELLTLFDAMVDQDMDQIELSKKKLEKYRKKLIKLQA